MLICGEIGKPLLVLKAFKKLEGKIKECEEVKKIGVDLLKLSKF